MKSRFSHRIIRCSPPSVLSDYVLLAKSILKSPIPGTPPKPHQDLTVAEDKKSRKEWHATWDESIDVSFTLIDRFIDYLSC